MKNIVYILSFMITFSLYSFSGELHLHVKDFQSSYKKALEHPLVVDYFNSEGFKIFKESKLYLRLKSDFENINFKNNLFTEKKLKRLSAKSFDLYLMETINLNFMVVAELEVSQLMLLLEMDQTNLPKSELNGETIYLIGNLYLMIKNNLLFITNYKNNLANYLKDKNSFSTMEPNKDYDNFIYLNMNKILSLPYLRNYWFTDSNFEDIGEKAEIFFNLSKKEFIESTKVYLKDEVKSNNNKILKGNFLIKVKTDDNILLSVFDKIKEVSIYNVGIKDKKSKIFVANITLKKEDLKEKLLKLYPNASWKEKDSIIEFKYGLMNRKNLFFKFDNNKLIISLDKNVNYSLEDNSNSILLDFNKKGITLLKEELGNLNKNRNLSYTQFYNNFFKIYLKHISSFYHKVSVKKSILTSYTKISF